MKKRTISILDLPEVTKVISTIEKIRISLKKGKKSHVQLINDTGCGTGNITNNTRTMLRNNQIKKVTCKCCNITELYELI